MDKKYWDKIYETYNVEIFDVLKSDRNDVIKSAIEKLASKKKVVGDIGCGIGKWLPLLSSNFKKVYAIDYMEPGLKFIEKNFKRLKNVECLLADMTIEKHKPGKYDVILCVNALMMEQSNKRTNFFYNLYASLNKNGSLILVIPSLESILFSEFICDKVNQKKKNTSKKATGAISISENSHLKNGIVSLDNVPHKHFLKEELISILSDLGLEVEKVEKVQYSWDTELDSPPKWLKAPYPWDWMVHAKKSK